MVAPYVEAGPGQESENDAIPHSLTTWLPWRPGGMGRFTWLDPRRWSNKNRDPDGLRNTAARDGYMHLGSGDEPEQDRPCTFLGRGLALVRGSRIALKVCPECSQWNDRQAAETGVCRWCCYEPQLTDVRHEPVT